MAATDQHYRNQKTLDIVFAVSCVLMLISTIWMLVQDYNREFKQVQREFRDVEATINDRMLYAQLPEDLGDWVDETDELSKEVEEARKALTKKQEELANKSREIQTRRDKQDALARSLKADFDAKSSYLVQTLDALSKAPAGDKALEDKKKAQEKELKTLAENLEKEQKKLEEIDTEFKTEISDVLKPLEDALSTASDKLKLRTKKIDQFAKAASQKSWKFGDTFRNLPILDAFASPTRINQILLPDLTIDYSFKEVPRNDRCMTCHLGIDRSTFDRDKLRELGHATPVLKKKLAAVRKILELRQKRGEELGFDLDDLPKNVRTKKLTNGQVTMFASHPKLDLYVDANSKHPVEKFGCTICHGGQGSATEFNLASHTPADSHQEHAWDKSYQWQSNHYWDYPMLSSRFTESSCLKCHHQVTDLIRDGSKKEAPKLLRGYDLVRENGCFGCHDISGTKSGRSIGPDLRLEPTPPLDWLTPIEQDRIKNDPLNPPGTYRKVGPSLRRLTEKTNEGWTRRWIASPRNFRPDTKMPHFYGLSTNSEDMLPDDQKAFPAAEMHAITHYLFVESQQSLEGKDTYRTALLKSLADGRPNSEKPAGQNKLKKELLDDKEKKDLDDDTKALTDLALLSVPASSSDINAAAAEVRRLQDRLQELYRRSEEENKKLNRLQKMEDDSDAAEAAKGIEKSLQDLSTDAAKDAAELTAQTARLIKLAKPVPIADVVRTVDGMTASLETAVEQADKKNREVHARFLGFDVTTANPRTPEQRLTDGKNLFTTKGCLACHSHEGTEGAGKEAVVGEANFGPNLSRMVAKLKPAAKNDARRWLYQWILNPNIHHPRTNMPVTRLTEVEALDVADWLLKQNVTDYTEQDPPDPKSLTLRQLARVYLAKAPGMTRADVDAAIPLDTSKQMGFAETRLKWMARDAEELRLKSGATTDDDLKWYIGKKSVSRLGCFACHDVPGFEQAKPIGTTLNDWGKKDPERLAFEDADSYVEKHSVIMPDRKTRKEIEDRIEALETRKSRDNRRLKDLGNQKPDDLVADEPLELADLRALTPLTETEEAELKELKARLQSGPFWQAGKDLKEPYEQHFFEALEHHSRQGFLHQKLMEPRSFDYNRTRTWDDRLRMPKFQFARTRRHAGETLAEFTTRQSKEEAEAREDVMTFILGLTAENISPKYINKPAPDRYAEVKGRQVLDKFNCVGCHQVRSGIFEFRLPSDTIAGLKKVADESQLKYATDKYAFPGHNAWTGTDPMLPDRLTAFGNFNPQYNPGEKPPKPLRNGHPVTTAGNYAVRLNQALRFTDSTGLTRDIPAAEMIGLPRPDIVRYSEPYGGKFVELMVPYLITVGGSNVDPDKARNVLPPPLHRESERVQPNWLYQFLLNPKTVRPEVILNMPRFNMSPEEASALVDYFVAVEKLTNPSAGAGTPHVVIPQRDDSFWQHGTTNYIGKLKERKELDGRLKGLDPAAARDYQERDAYAVDSYRLLTNGACAKCHIVNGKGEKQAPSLDLAAERLRPEWTKRWIANPQAMFSYNPSMPVNIEKKVANSADLEAVLKKNEEERKKVFQDLFVGTSLDQVSAIRDVLMDLARIASLPANREKPVAPPGGKP